MGDGFRYWLIIADTKTFPVLGDDHMAAALFSKTLAEGKEGCNQKAAETIITILVPGTDVLQKAVMRAKLLCGMGECSSASAWAFASARKQL